MGDETTNNILQQIDEKRLAILRTDQGTHPAGD